MPTASRLAFAAFAFALGAASAPGCAGAQQRPPPPTRQPTLADRLDLRPDQQPAFRAYQDEMAFQRADAAHFEGEISQLNAMKTPDRIAYSLSELPKRETSERRAAKATLAFYNVLSSDQQATFDRITRIPTPGAPPRASVPKTPGTLRTPPPGGALPLPRPASPEN